jgi:hypothetical protein
MRVRQKEKNRVVLILMTVNVPEQSCLLRRSEADDESQVNGQNCGVGSGLSSSAALAQMTDTKAPAAEPNTTASQPAPKPVGEQIIMQIENTVLGVC